jgi:hypothetical protein
MMKWTLSRQNKMAASGVLFALCLLVLFSNYIVSNYMDRHHSDHVKKSIRTLYEDRLLPEEYILKMTHDVYQIKEALSAPESDSAHNRITASLSDIRVLCNAYLKTKLTESENTKFAELLKTVDELESSPLPKMETNANKALALLSELSTIQLNESKRIMDHSEILSLSGNTPFKFYSIIAIIILLILQALVLTFRTLHNDSKHTSPHSLH